MWMASVAIVLLEAGLVTPSFAGEEIRPRSEEPQSAGALPLKTTRTIRFTTREGTHLSVDVSPDGRTIVFDLLGDLYVLPISGGHATRITSGPAVDKQPRFSPDGRHLLFLSDRKGFDGVWMADADGSHPHEILSSRPSRHAYSFFVAPAWMPDGRGIVVSRLRKIKNYVLAAYDLSGRPLDIPLLRRMAAVAAARDTDVYVAGASFSRNPRFLYATRLSSSKSEPGNMHYQIARLDLAQSRESFVTDELSGAVAPLISPDGKTLIYATMYPSKEGPATGLKLMRVDDDSAQGVPTWIAPRVEHSVQQSFVMWGNGFMPGSAFLPDSSAVVTSFDGKLWRIALPSGHATEIPFTADVEQQLGPLLRFPANGAWCLLRSTASGSSRHEMVFRAGWPFESRTGHCNGAAAQLKEHLPGLPMGAISRSAPGRSEAAMSGAFRRKSSCHTSRSPYLHWSGLPANPITTTSSCIGPMAWRWS
jgi:hypothetical protein